MRSHLIETLTSWGKRRMKCLNIIRLCSFLVLINSLGFHYLVSSYLSFTSRAWFWFCIWASNPHFICLIDPSPWTSHHQLNLRMSETKLSIFFSRSLIPLDQWYNHSCHSDLRLGKPYCFFLQKGYCIHILLSVLIVTDPVYTISAYIWIILNNYQSCHYTLRCKYYPDHRLWKLPPSKSLK